MTADEIIRGFDKAKGDRMVVDNSWESYSYYIIPRKRGIQSTVQPGDKPEPDVYDSTAIESNLIMAAGLSGYLTNASQRWFDLQTRNQAIMEMSEVRSYFNTVSNLVYSALAASNFYQQINEVYLDMGAFGQGCLYCEDDVKEDIRYYARHPKEVYCIENEREIVDMIYREFEMSAWQAYNMFGRDVVGESVVKCVEERKDYGKMVKFLNYVAPRSVREVGKKDAKNMPYSSYYINMEDKKIVRESGYEEFPFMIPRFFKNSGEVYGYGPAATSYPDIRMINDMGKLYIQAQEIALYPPWLAENDGLMGSLDLRAAAINYQRRPVSEGQSVVPLKSGTNFQAAFEFLDRIEKRIQRAFFVDLFLALAQHKNMTATEVLERTQEKMLILGPVLGRLQGELLNPVLQRTFAILMRRGVLPPPPEVLQGQDLDIVYVSPLAKAQRAVQGNDMRMFLGSVMEMAQAAPSVLDKINWDKVVDKGSKIYSIDPDIILDQEEADAIRQQRAEAAQQQMKMQNLLAASQVAKQAGGAAKDYAAAKQSTATPK